VGGSIFRGSGNLPLRLNWGSSLKERKLGHSPSNLPEKKKKGEKRIRLVSRGGEEKGISLVVTEGK